MYNAIMEFIRQLDISTLNFIEQIRDSVFDHYF